MKIKKPFFIINPKNFLNLREIEDLALYTDKLVKQLDLTVFFTAPTPYLHEIAKKTEKLVITAQNISVNKNKNTMGNLAFHNIRDINAKAVVLNHDENPLSISEIISGINQANEANIISIVCANSVQEAKMIATCNPTIILAEEVDLIGGDQLSDDNFLKNVIEEVKNVNPNILVEYGAGIKNAEDVEKLLSTNLDGVGVTSGIVKASDPKKITKQMLKVVKEIKESQ